MMIFSRTIVVRYSYKESQLQYNWSKTIIFARLVTRGWFVHLLQCQACFRLPSLIVNLFTVYLSLYDVWANIRGVSYQSEPLKILNKFFKLSSFSKNVEPFPAEVQFRDHRVRRRLHRILRWSRRYFGSRGDPRFSKRQRSFSRPKNSGFVWRRLRRARTTQRWRRRRCWRRTRCRLRRCRKTICPGDQFRESCSFCWTRATLRSRLHPEQTRHLKN